MCILFGNRLYQPRRSRRRKARSAIAMTSPTSSNNTGVDVQKKFFVKNVPVDWDDWRLFSVFSKFGLVSSVRVRPSKSNSPCYHFAFVDMLGFEDADKVRAALNEKRQLKVEGACLWLEDIRDPSVPVSDDVANKENDKNGQDKNKENSNDTKMARYPSSARFVPKNNVRKPPTLKIFPRDLPINQPTQVVTVSAPPDAPTDTLRIFVKVNADPSEAYKNMQHALNAYVKTTPPDGAGQVAIGDFVIVLSENDAALRARVISLTTVYLIDFGDIRACDPSHMWLIRDQEQMRIFALPSLVIETGLEGVQLKTQKQIPQVIKVLSSVPPKLRLMFRLRRFVGRVNMVQAVLECDDEPSVDLGVALVTKGMAAYNPMSEPEEAHKYGRDELRAVEKASEQSKILASVDAPLLEELSKGVGTISVA